MGATQFGAAQDECSFCNTREVVVKSNVSVRSASPVPGTQTTLSICVDCIRKAADEIGEYVTFCGCDCDECMNCENAT